MPVGSVLPARLGRDGAITQGVHYSLNNGSAIPDSSLNGFNYPPNGADAQTKGPPRVRFDQPLPDNPPVQTTRFTKIDPSIALMNSKFHAQLGGTVWVHYKLVGDQWPTRPGTFTPIGKYPVNAGAPFPNDHVANTSAETYFQNTPIPLLGNSCMECHYQAAFTDFSWTVNDEAWPPSPQTTEALMAKPMNAAAKSVATRRVNAFTVLEAAMSARFASAPGPTPPKPKQE
jgi:hypothetical protein